MNLLTQRTQRSERTKYFLFINKIVTDGVGHLRTYGPRGQVKGGRGPSVVPRLRDYGGFWVEEEKI
jgi:hypothetical protein